ncbi:N-acyl homoserine lactonase family protein [Pendulispora albinea]|uniref:N-acyl homoserine lactonase family protein n=1 Tax=Pendulispora albinea TaxID=2741071 RepID=A0ABZ2MB87_9BACT
MSPTLRHGCTLLVLSALVSCAGEKPVVQQPESTVAHAPAPASKMERGLRLYAFDCGEIDILDISFFHPETGTGKGEKKKFAASCYLVVHPKGTLAWDAGLRDDLAKLPEGKTFVRNGKPFAVQHVHKTLVAQYKEIGIDPGSIDFIGISHMHADHNGNANLFPKATLLMQKEEYEAAFGPEPAKFGFDPTNYPTLKDNPVKKLEGDFDVFGDGSVLIRRAIGHTPGHQTLFVKLPKTGNVLLSGDMVHFTENWKNHGIPAFNFDKKESLASIEKAEQFLTAHHATLWIQHDYEQNQTIRHAPGYYE